MIHIITGPPCAGKSTYVQEHAKVNDLQVDYDLIAQALGAANSHAAEGLVKQAAFAAREGAIKTAIKYASEEPDAWIIHTTPSAEHVKMYEAAGADFIELNPGYEICVERANADGRPQQTFDAIERYFAKGANKMNLKTKSIEVKSDNGTIAGYASTWIREPDSYGDVVAQGAFSDSIETIRTEGKTLPLLWNHAADDLKCYIGRVTALKEDDHGLYFEAEFDETEEGQRARQLAADGRICKFSFAYDIIEQAPVILDDGREANELRKLNIHEISMVMYPANPDTSIVSVKSGRRNSAKDEEAIRQAIALLQGVLEDIPEQDSDDVKSEEPDTVNDEERIAKLLKEAEILLSNKEGSK